MWRAFRRDGTANDIPESDEEPYQHSSSSRPDRPQISVSNESSIVLPIYSKIASDVSGMRFKHCKTDDNGRYIKTINSTLNNVLNTEANIDQTGRDLMRDIVISLIDEGCIAVVPVETSINPLQSDRMEIHSLRVGKITQWFPNDVRVELYNERNGTYQEITIAKSKVAIIENPHYLIMNEPNSTLRRLITKLNLLDAVDNQSGSGKLDLIIQLPFTIKTEARRAQAEKRISAIEAQLTNTKYGIAYTDATEKIVQLNRSVVNNLLEQVTYLTNSLYSQLGISEGVYMGTASEAEMLNYYSRTIVPIVDAVVTEMKRKFLNKAERDNNESILSFRDPFKLVPVSQLAEIADKFTRNEIASSNDMRSVLGWEPSDDPSADELRNKNIPAAKQEVVGEPKNLNKNIKEKEDSPNEV